MRLERGSDNDLEGEWGFTRLQLILRVCIGGVSERLSGKRARGAYRISAPV